jgi:hypothetical protein
MSNDYRLERTGSAFTVIRWDEKAGLQRDAISSR